ncbi:MAG: DUF4384 domain-containing protein [Alphaproteobacteria bacterium]
MRFFIVVLCALLVPAVGRAIQDPETAASVTVAKTPVMKTMTSFTPALQCMDEMMIAYGIQGITITSPGVSDQTQKVTVGTRDMLINALSLISRKSKAFTFIDYDPQNGSFFNDAQRASGNAGYAVPTYYIRGAITQFDNNVIQNEVGGELASLLSAVEDMQTGTLSVVAIDLNVGNTLTRQVLPGLESTNSITIKHSSSEEGGSGQILKAGVSISMSVPKSEGLGAAVRSLIELGVIETMGQLTQVPYWKCLEIEKTNPTMQQVARDWYDSLSEADRVLFIQRKLAGLGLYDGPIGGIVDADTTNAVLRYQADHHDLIANGRIGFALYYSLLDDRSPLRDAPKKTLLGPTVAETEKPVIGLRITSERGDSPAYGVKQILNASVEMDRNAFLYCFYQDTDGNISRLLPNRFRPNAFVRSRSVPLSSTRQTVKIRFDKLGTEHISCVAMNKEVPLPAEIMTRDLVKLDLNSLDEIASMFRSVDEKTVEARMDITVE